MALFAGGGQRRGQLGGPGGGERDPQGAVHGGARRDLGAVDVGVVFAVAQVLPDHQVVAAAVGHRRCQLVRRGAADGKPRGVQQDARGADPGAVDVPRRVGLGAVVLPDHQVAPRPQGHRRSLLICQLGRHGDAHAVEQLARGADPGPVDVPRRGRRGAGVLPDHEVVGAVKDHGRVLLVGGGGADPQGLGVHQAAVVVDPHAVDVGHAGALAVVLPDHQVAAAAVGHRRVQLVVGCRGQRHPGGVYQLAAAVHLGPVDVAALLPDHQVTAAAEGHRRGQLVAAGLSHGHACQQGPRGGDQRAVNIVGGDLVVAEVLPDHQVVGAVVGDCRGQLVVGRR